MTHPLAEDLNQVLEHTTGLWELLRGKRVFLTGGTGFLGRWLLESYLWASDRLDLKGEMLVLTRNPSRFIQQSPHLAMHTAVNLIEGDQTDFQFPKGSLPILIHGAVEYGDASTILDRNLNGARRLYELASQCGAERVLFTSSGAVYGSQPTDIPLLTEGFMGGPDPTLLSSAYGEMKRITECMGVASAERAGFGFLIARCFAFMGPYLRLDQGSAVGNFIGSALKSEAIQITGDGTPLRSYLYASDLAIWLWTILLRGIPGRPYNVGSEEAFSIREVANRVSAVAAPGLPVLVVRTPNTIQRAERYLPSTARTREELGLAQHIGLDDAIARTVRWHRRGLTEGR